MSFLDPKLAQSNGRDANTILFQDLTLKEAFQLFDEARDALASRRLRSRNTDYPIGPVTVSGGVTQVRDGVSPGDVLGESDDALYRAKGEGWNRIIAAQV
jgi:diguanylate cyclase